MSLRKKINNLLEENLRKQVFSCVSIGISYKNPDDQKRTIVYSTKSTDEYYIKERSAGLFFDLASLTKPFATTLSLLSLLKEKKISVDARLEDILEEEIPAAKKNITIEQLLSHTAGFPPHREYYKKLAGVEVRQRKKLLLDLLLKEPLAAEPGRHTEYSDLGFMLLGLLIERITGLGLDEYFTGRITVPVGLEEHLFFKPAGLKKYRAARFAPVEFCPWRGRLLRGEISDENCWVLGGVCGHAGLYGDIKGVLELSGLILDIWLGKREHPNLERGDLLRFVTRRGEGKDAVRALGFDRPSPAGASCGQYFSAGSIGHLGFTGTSFWIDPDRELVIAVLSNRVHPSRDNEAIKKFRPEIHDRIVEWLGLA